MEAQVSQSTTSVDPKSLGEARVQAQNAAQWLARLANSFIEPEAGQRHLWLTFDPVRHALVTRPFAGDLTVELRLPALELQFREGGKLVPHILNVEGHTPAKIEAWVLVELLHRGIDRDRFSKTLPYTPPNLMSGDDTDYSPEACARELDALTRWFVQGSAVLAELAREMEPVEGPEGGLLCWPEQFHIGFLTGAEPGGVVAQRALRVGLSAGDDRNPEPYFFVAVQKDGDVETPHPGAVLTASRIIGEQYDTSAIAGTLRAAVTTARRRLSN